MVNEVPFSPDMMIRPRAVRSPPLSIEIVPAVPWWRFALDSMRDVRPRLTSFADVSEIWPANDPSLKALALICASEISLPPASIMMEPAASR